MPWISVRSTRDGMCYEMPSTNPDLIGRWLVETLERVKPDQTCPAQIQMRPLWIADPDAPDGGRPDWTTNHVIWSDRYLVGGEETGALRQLAGELVKYADLYDREREQLASEQVDEKGSAVH